MGIYPDLLIRIKAVFTDSIIIIIMLFSFSAIVSNFNNLPTEVTKAAYLFIFFLYDPIFTSLFGGTIGHMIMGLKVRKSNNKEKNIHFLAALLRFLCKATLGWVSLITISRSEEKKAIHDLAVNSIVIYG